ncbi:N-acylglucosamine 2-epimerase [Saccharothrix sp. NRRL B-16348]|uniref:thioredoxin domain-containing protein n=1 Tax=Saccharothrix sp. NRRL B-16348 TaxID=1415542 RepID=UPI0006AFCE0E|nr:thioredoxin domain-containing protein [Saccharothrix sp. NRRL B-16348]KOX21420.1 N-acylglucosamine 2-epimerase [Saccharothrix sp. NRRL B-16348]
MTNRLASSTSPYLLQHADNPVHWRPWSPEAFEEARERGVPVLLSVGYAACHWCHVMAHESFEDEATAAYMNEHFVNVKVDREERPDVDAVYMAVTQALSGHGGWPMTCFLTPDGEPFYAGTYYPPSPRPGLPSFRQVLEAIDHAWREQGDEVRESAAGIVAQLAFKPLPQSTVDDEVLAGAVVSLLGHFDRVNAGFGGAPKFPPSMVLEFLLRHHERTGSVEALSMARTTCDAMANGGLYDQLAGGFARYSVDAAWVVPHFEKMLYDNALLLRAYTHLSRRDDNPRYRQVVRDTAEFLIRDLGTAEGGFAASLDADTDGVEGLTYVWTPAQLVQVLGLATGARAAALYGVTDEGTFEHGASTLRMLGSPDPEIAAKLLQARDRRPQPGRDDKVVTAWNGLAIAALAEAGAVFGEPRWVEAAVRAASLVLDVHLVDGRLLRTSRNGAAGTAAGVLEDYGCFADGLLALHQATGDVRWFTVACGLLDTALARFAGEEPGVYYDTADDAEALVQRPSDPSDNASPSGASALASALVTASVLGGPSTYRDAAEAALGRAGLLAAREPRFAGHWLSVAEALALGPVQVAVVGDASDLVSAAWTGVHGGGVVVAGAPDSAPLLADRPLVDGGAAAYVCRGYVCDRPVTSVAELTAALAVHR